MSKPIRILVVGCGHMGMSHAKAHRHGAVHEPLRDHQRPGSRPAVVSRTRQRWESAVM